MLARKPRVKNVASTGQTTKRSFQKSLKKKSHLLIHGGIGFAVVVLLIAGSSFRTTEDTAEAVVTRSGDYTPIATLDTVAAAEIAATIARDANLLVANNVRNMADSLNAQVEFSAAEGTYVDKPQIVATEAKTNQDITEYTVQAGEDLNDIARRFNVTTDTIRWANDFSGDVVSAGRKLIIPPVSGLIYEVKDGDTPQVLAQKYQANAEQIIAFNDAEVAGLQTGQRIVIPNGVKPAPTPAQVTYVAAGPSAVQSTAFAFGGSQPLYGGNGYSYGYCTWHAANRRIALGLQMPRNLGNAVTWAALGARSGMGVSGAPQAGAILWHKNTYIAGGLGHVGFVEGVNADGSVSVSDMNYPIWGVVTYRTIPASEVGSYLYIY
jgi:surface antigen